jgi:hypothetical protein
MSTMVADTQDRFAEVFGTRRGSRAAQTQRDRDELRDAAQGNPKQPDGSIIACTGGCGASVKASLASRLAPNIPWHYCPDCLPTAQGLLARAKDRNQRSKAIDTSAKRAVTEPLRAEKRRKRQERREDKRRWHKCFLSCPFGHAWVRPAQSARAEMRGVTHVCAGCDKKLKRKNGH